MSASKPPNKKTLKTILIVLGIAIIIWLLLRNKGQLAQAIQDGAVPGFDIIAGPNGDVITYDIPGFEYEPRDYPLPSIPEAQRRNAPCNFCVTSRATITYPVQPVSRPAPAPQHIISFPKNRGGAYMSVSGPPVRTRYPGLGGLRI